MRRDQLESRLRDLRNEFRELHRETPGVVVFQSIDDGGLTEIWIASEFDASFARRLYEQAFQRGGELLRQFPRGIFRNDFDGECAEASLVRCNDYKNRLFAWLDFVTTMSMREQAVVPFDSTPNTKPIHDPFADQPMANVCRISYGTHSKENEAIRLVHFGALSAVAADYLLTAIQARGEQGEAAATEAAATEADGNDELSERVKNLEIAARAKRPKSKRDRIRTQRLKFCVSRRKRGDTWEQIYRDYLEAIRSRKTYIEDKKARPDTLRQMCEQYHPELKR